MYMHITGPSIQKPAGVLNFHFGMSVRPEGLKIGAWRTDSRQIWGLKERFLSRLNLVQEET